MRPRTSAILIVCAVAAVYANSLSNPFVFDDFGAIVSNTNIQSLRAFHPLAAVESPTANRPLVELSFALNYALGATSVTGYRIVNIALHAACALLVYALVREVLRTLGDRRRAATLATAAALIWAVHPLNSEVVNYATQRSESMMALFFLLTVFAAARRWHVAAVVACLSGMLCKETMVVAPLMVLLYDRQFVSGSFAGALRARPRFYACLAATYAIPVYLLSTHARTTSAGFAISIVGPLTYLWNQCVMIPHYLFLAVWPRALVVYYGWPRPLTLGEVWPSALILAVLLVAVIVAYARRVPGAFAALWVFLTLAPASSLIVVGSEVGAERRMYLPLVGLIPLVVVAAEAGLRRLGARRRIGVAAAAVVVLALSVRTFARNQEYASGLTLAYTVLDRWPTPAAYGLVGTELGKLGRHDEAVDYLRRAASDDPLSRYDLGVELFLVGRFQESMDQLRAYAEQNPRMYNVTEAHKTAGRAAMSLGRWSDAETELRAVLRTSPGDSDAAGLLGEALLRQGRAAEAIPFLERYVSTHPPNGAACTGLGVARASVGDADAAIAAFQCAVKADPSSLPFRLNLANALLNASRLANAEQEARAAVFAAPSDPAGHEMLARVLMAEGRDGEARVEAEAARRIR